MEHSNIKNLKLIENNSIFGDLSLLHEEFRKSTVIALDDVNIII